VSRRLVVVVAKRSLYDRAVRERRDPKVMALFQRRDISVANWRKAHLEHERTLKKVQGILNELGVSVTTLRGPGVVFDASDAALVISVGGDGTLLAASHHVGTVPILGVNSAPQHSVGFFCPANAENVRSLLEAAFAGTLPSVSLARMQVSVNNRVCSRRVLNEALFSHANPAATSRYIVSEKGRSEEQRSSGVWVGTAAGSTAATRSAGGRVLSLASRRLQLVVREPYIEPGEKYALDRLIIEPDEHVTLLSKMEDARLYLDGPYRQVPVELGDRVMCSLSEEPLTVFGLGRRRAKRSHTALSVSVPKRTPRKAPTKRAPAKRTPAKRAPAKRAPAKRAPAKRAPAKKAPRG
jgi:NAD+ kinase